MEMLLSCLLLVAFLQFSFCTIYIDRADVDSNPKYASISVNFIHDPEGNSVTNVTFTTFINVTKLMIYFKIKLAENDDDKEFRRQFVSSVVDSNKVFSGQQSNGIISRFFDAFKRSAASKFVTPLPSVYLKLF